MRFSKLIGIFLAQNFVDPATQLGLSLHVLGQLFVELHLRLHLPILTILNRLVKESLEIELADGIRRGLQHVPTPNVKESLRGNRLQRLGYTSVAEAHEAEHAAGALGFLTEVMVA